MPLAISVRHLHELIKKRLEEKFLVSTPAIPSQEWICLQISPSNPFSEIALRYTGRFNVKFGIQIRQLRKDYPDSHYVSALLRYVKDFSIEYRNNIVVISVDDKCTIPVGDPDGAVSTKYKAIIALLSLSMGHSCSLRPRLSCAWHCTICNFFH